LPDTYGGVSLSLPIDPTTSDPSPTELLNSLPSDAAFRRVLSAVDLDPTIADDIDRKHVIEDLSEVDRRRAAEQIQFAAPTVLHHFEVPDLRSMNADEIRDRVNLQGFGAQLRTVAEVHDRIYAICSVPDGGTQSQLTTSEDARKTTVATYSPGTAILSIRAATGELAKSTLGAVLTDAEQAGAEALSFSDSAVRERFEEKFVQSYTTLTLTPRTDDTETEEIILKTRASSKTDVDFRNDEFAREILRSSELKRAHGRLILESSIVSTGLGDDVPIRVDVDFQNSVLSFERFLPEKAFIQIEQTVASLF
jgi:hypothetical protein